jgi:hypothetical protein
MTRIEFTNNFTGTTLRAILHRELEDGTIVVSYMGRDWENNTLEVRRYRSFAKWQYAGLTLAPKRKVAMSEPTVEHIRDHYTAVLMSPHSTTMQRLWANAQLNLIFADYEVR